MVPGMAMRRNNEEFRGERQGLPLVMKEDRQELVNPGEGSQAASPVMGFEVEGPSGAVGY